MAPRAFMPGRRAAALLVALVLATACDDQKPPMLDPVTGCKGDDALEENDVIGSATSIGLGTHTAMGCIQDHDIDPDFFAFSGKPGRTYRARLEATSGVGNWSLYLLDPAGALVRREADGSFVMPAGGQVVIQVTPQSTAALKPSGQYQLTLELPNAAPTVAVTYSPQSPEIGDEVTFTAATHDPDGDAIASITWRFADGGSATGPAIRRSFMDAGSQLVRAVAADEFGGRDSASVQFDVKAIVRSIEITPSALYLGAIGDTARLTAVARDRLGRVVGSRTASWLTSSSGIATVRDNGLITSAGNGTAVVTASVDNVAGHAAVVVSQKPAGITVTPASLELSALGQTAMVTATVVDARGNPVASAPMAFASTNAAVATIDESGQVTARANGTARMLVMSGDAQGEFTVVVRQRAARVLVRPAETTLAAVGDTVQLTAAAFDAREHPIASPGATWSATGDAVQVNASGAVWAVQAGEGSVRATVDGVSGNGVVRVVPRLARIEVTPGEASLRRGETVQLTARGYDRRGGSLPVSVTWQTSDAGVAVVSQAGLVEAVAAGTAQVYALSGEITGSMDVVVASGAATQFVLVGNGQTGALGSPLAALIGVRALDERGSPVGGVEVTFTAADGSVSPAVVHTDGNGYARTSWTLAATLGPQQASAVVGVLGTAAFMATAVAGPAAALALNADTANLLALGQTRQFTASATDAYGNPIAAPAIAWQVVDGAVASVNASGLVTAVANGSTLLIATSNGHADSASIHVQQVADTILLSPASGSVAVDSILRFSASVRDANGHVIPGAAITWGVVDIAIAEMVESGIVLGRAVGVTQVRAASGPAVTLAQLNVLAGPPPTARYFVVSGGMQVGYMGEAVANPIRITAYARLFCHSDGCEPADPVAGAQIQLQATHGTLGSTVVTTDATGVGSTTYTLPAALGEDTVIVWSTGAQAQVGWSRYADTLRTRFLATERLTGKRFVKVSAGDEDGGATTCAITDDGIAYCWGSNTSGKLGIGADDWEPRVPVRVAGDMRWLDISAAGWHTCGITTDNRAWCWGDGDQGGAADDSESHVPRLVDTSERFTKIAAGLWATCAISTSSKLWCWGDGSYGALGTGTTSWQQTPVRASSELNFKQVVMGNIFFGCALTLGNEAYCWGANESGQLGDGTRAHRYVPTAVTTESGVTGFTELTAHEDHVCGIGMDSNSWCWGYNPSGVLGNGDYSRMGVPYWNPQPQAALGGWLFRTIATGTYHTCAVGTNVAVPGIPVSGTVACWGSNGSYQFGNGTTTPGEVHEPTGGQADNMSFAQLSAGSAHTCGITTSGELWCWGENRSGEVGVGSTASSVTRPARVGAPGA